MVHDSIHVAKKSWSQAPDQHVFSALENIQDFDENVQSIILEEVEKRIEESPAKEQQVELEKISNYKTLDYWITLLYIASVVSFIVGFLFHWAFFIQAVICMLLAKGIARRNKLAGVIVFLLCLIASLLPMATKSPANVFIVPVGLFFCYLLGYRTMIGIFRYNEHIENSESSQNLSLLSCQDKEII